MYDSGNYTVKINDKLHGNVVSRTGVKQGCCMSPILSNIFQNDLHDIFDEKCVPLKLGHKHINSLSWADDLVLMSSSPAGLQRCLDKLYDYCYKWGLSVNQDKTKCMVINDHSKSSSHIFYYNQHILENVTSYTYLGFHMHRSNKMSYTVEDRVKKSKRMIYPIKQLAMVGSNRNIPVAISVFDKQVIPVLLYGAAIWSLPTKTRFCYANGIMETNENTKSMLDKYITDKLGRHIDIKSAKRVGKKSNLPRKVLLELKSVSDKNQLLFNQSVLNITNFDTKDENKTTDKNATNFYKFLLDQSKFASSLACMSELGRYPTYIKAWTLAVKYWVRLEKGTKNVLLNLAYEEERVRKNWWYSSLEMILQENGMADVLQNGKGLNPAAFANYFGQRLKDQHIQKWQTSIKKSQRLTIKDRLIYDRAQYLDHLTSGNLKKIFTKLRVGHNNLGYSVKSKQTTCPYCPIEVETIEHTLLSCKEYETARNTLFDAMKDKGKYDKFMAENDKEKAKNLLEISHYSYLWDIKSHVCRFIAHVDKIRKI